MKYVIMNKTMDKIFIKTNLGCNVISGKYKFSTVEPLVFKLWVSAKIFSVLRYDAVIVKLCEFNKIKGNL